MWMAVGLLSALLFFGLAGYGAYSLVKKNGRAKKAWLGSLAAFALFGAAAVHDTQTPSGNNARMAESSMAQSSTEPATARTAPIVNGKWGTVTRVVDGDTVEIDNGEKVRLIGVNAPETVKPDAPAFPMGKEASDFTKSQLEGKRVLLETDVQTRDRYGRTLGYLYVKDPKSRDDVEKYMFNAILIREGYAQLMTVPPNVKYSDLFVKLQKQAREQNKGLWALGIYKDSVTSSDDVFLEGKEPNKQKAMAKGTPSSGASAGSSADAASDSGAPAAAPAQPAAATVKIVSVTSPVVRNSYATVVAQVPPNTSATIAVRYKSAPGTAQGLGPKTSDANGRVSWTWKVGSNTTLGSWPVTVTAGGISDTVYFEVVH